MRQTAHGKSKPAGEQRMRHERNGCEHEVDPGAQGRETQGGVKADACR